MPGEIAVTEHGQALGAEVVKMTPPAGYLAFTKIAGMAVADWITFLTLFYMALLVLGQLYPDWRRDLVLAFRESTARPVAWLRVQFGRSKRRKGRGNARG